MFNLSVCWYNVKAYELWSVKHLGIQANIASLFYHHFDERHKNSFKQYTYQ